MAVPDKAAKGPARRILNVIFVALSRRPNALWLFERDGAQHDLDDIKQGPAAPI